MTTPIDPYVRAKQTNADMSTKSYLAVIANGDDDIDVSGANGIVIGVLGDMTGSPADTNDKMVEVQQGRICKVKFGGTVAAGVSVKSDANGKAVAATTDLDKAFGVAEESYVSGDTGAVNYFRHDISV